MYRVSYDSTAGRWLVVGPEGRYPVLFTNELMARDQAKALNMAREARTKDCGS